jgi:hypothetical protein
MSEITKLYKNAGIKPERQDCCKIADKYWASNTESGFEYLMQKECPYNQECTDECEYAYDKVVYPPFTAEKQLSLFQWVCKKFEEIYISYTDFGEVKNWEIVYKISIHRNSFEECLCAFINLFWQSLTPEEKQQVKGILE